MTFQVYIRSRCKWSCGEGGGLACACEHILDYTNYPENFLTLILHYFIRSLLHFIFSQIRPIFSILRIVKLALKYQTIKRGGYFSTPFMQEKLEDLLLLYNCQTPLPHLASNRRIDPICLLWWLSCECLEGVWKLSGECLAGVRRVSGGCLVAVWWVSGGCLVSVWS